MRTNAHALENSRRMAGFFFRSSTRCAAISSSCDGWRVQTAERGTTIGCPTPTVCTPTWTPNGSSCDPGFAPQGTSCNDGDTTTKNDQCNGSGGCTGTPIQCPAPSACITGYTTDGSGCVPTYAAQGTSCNDQNNATQDDQCNGTGTCTGTPYSCPVGDICTPSYTQDGVGCVANYAPSGTTCGSASNACKLPETCDGGGVCQAEENAANGSPCGDTNSTTCSAPDSCLNGVCQPNHASGSTVCGTASGQCKNAATCNGQGACGSETNKPNGTSCGSSANTSCTNPDTCVSGVCQDNHASAGTVCGTASSDCRNAEVCDGAGTCGAESNKPNGTACGNQSDTACTDPDTCVAGQCVANHAVAGTICGSPSNDCRNAEICNNAGTCLGETNKADGTACGDQSVTICDKADSCQNGTCGENFAPINTPCGTASNDCRFGEVCSATGTCLPETNKPNGSACGNQTNTTCTDPDSCLNGTCNANHAPITTVCGTASNDCRNPETCTGAGTCGSETNKPNGTSCGSSANTACTNPDTCKSGQCNANHAPAGTTCGSATGVCKNDDICNNSGGCINGGNKPNGTPCGSQADTTCTNPDTCSAGKCAANHAPDGTYCGTAGQTCEIPSCSTGSCTGSTAASIGTECEYSIPTTGTTVCGTCTNNSAGNAPSCTVSTLTNGFCHKSAAFYCQTATTIFSCLPCPAGYNPCVLDLIPF